MPPQGTQQPNTVPTPEPIDVSSPNTMQLPKRSGGKTVLVVLLVIALVALSVAGTWYYMNKKLQDEKSQHQVQIDQLNVQVTTLQKQVDTANQTPAVAAGNNLKALYDLWIAGTDKGTDKAAMADESVSKNLVTTELGASLKSGKVNLFCSVTKPQSYVYTIPSATDKTVTSNMTLTGTNKQTINQTITNVDNNWKVSTVTCGAAVQ